MHLLRVPTWESQSQVGEYEHDPNQHETFLRKHYGTTKSVCLACGIQETMSTNCSGTGNQGDRLVTTTTLTHIALVLTAPKITRCNDATHTMEEVSVLKVSAVALQVYEQVSGEIWFENPPQDHAGRHFIRSCLVVPPKQPVRQKQQHDLHQNGHCLPNVSQLHTGFTAAAAHSDWALQAVRLLP